MYLGYPLQTGVSSKEKPNLNATVGSLSVPNSHGSPKSFLNCLGDLNVLCLLNRDLTVDAGYLWYFPSLVLLLVVVVLTSQIFPKAQRLDSGGTKLVRRSRLFLKRLNRRICRRGLNVVNLSSLGNLTLSLLLRGEEVSKFGKRFFNV